MHIHIDYIRTHIYFSKIFFATPWTAACKAPLSLHYLPEFAQIHVH